MCLGAALCVYTHPGAECGVLGVTAAPFVEGAFAVSAVLWEFIFPRLALLSFQTEKTALPKWCSACTELALSSASFQHSSKALSAVV